MLPENRVNHQIVSGKVTCSNAAVRRKCLLKDVSKLLMSK